MARACLMIISQPQMEEGTTGTYQHTTFRRGIQDLQRRIKWHQVAQFLLELMYMEMDQDLLHISFGDGPPFTKL